MQWLESIYRSLDPDLALLSGLILLIDILDDICIPGSLLMRDVDQRQLHVYSGLRETTLLHRNMGIMQLIVY